MHGSEGNYFEASSGSQTSKGRERFDQFPFRNNLKSPLPPVAETV